MDQKEDTKKTGPDQEQQTGQPATKPETGPDQGTRKPGLAMFRAEPARKCQICEGPNHHACGCEAKAAKEKSGIDLNALPLIHFNTGGNKATLCDPKFLGQKYTTNPYEVTCLDCRKLLPSPAPNITEAAPAASEKNFLGDTRWEQFENALLLFNEAVSYLKLIADDMITIRKTLCEVKQETEKPDQPEV